MKHEGMAEGTHDSRRTGTWTVSCGMFVGGQILGHHDIHFLLFLPRILDPGFSRYLSFP